MRLIDADALIKQIDTEREILINNGMLGAEHIVTHCIRNFIEDAPTVDIVRCGECKHASDNKVYGCMLNHFNDNDYDYHRMYADDFCSYGEREDE